jgi:hypothetical protein
MQVVALSVAGNLFVKMKPPNNKICLLSAKKGLFHGIAGQIATAIVSGARALAARLIRLSCAT